MAVEEADGQRAPVLVEPARLAATGLPPIRSLSAAVAAVPHAQVPNHLRWQVCAGFGRVDAFQPYARFADGDGIAVDDADMARERTGRDHPNAPQPQEDATETRPSASANATSPWVAYTNFNSRIG